MQNKINLRLKGGLGNQLFQLTALVYYSDKYMLEPSYETKRYLAFDQRGLEIAEIASQLGVKRNKLQPLVGRALLHQEKTEFAFQNELIRNGQKKNVLDGYFQHPGYLEGNERKILSAIIAKCKSQTQINLCPCNLAHATVHIRRGDYLNDINSKLFGVLSDDYFSRQISDLHRFHIQILSDSRIESFKFQGPSNSRIEILDYQMNAWQAFAHMVFSDVLVMSNSSLSWWAAKTAKFNDYRMQVVSPDTWFKAYPEANSLISHEWKTVKAEWQ